MLGTHPLQLSQYRLVRNHTRPFSVVWYIGDLILFLINIGTDAKRQTARELLIANDTFAFAGFERAGCKESDRFA